MGKPPVVDVWATTDALRTQVGGDEVQHLLEQAGSSAGAAAARADIGILPSSWSKLRSVSAIVFCDVAKTGCSQQVFIDLD